MILSILRVLVSFAGHSVRYLAVSALVMYAALSVGTGRFPAPVGEYYEHLQNLHTSMDVGNAPQQIRRTRQQEEEILALIGSDGVEVRTRAAAPVPSRKPADFRDAELRMRSLETEISHLKSELKRTRQELKKKKIRVAQGSVPH